MQETRTARGERTPTARTRPGIDITKVYPAWAVEVQPLGIAYGFHWSGPAIDAEHAQQLAGRAAMDAWPGFRLQVRSVVQVA